MARILILCIFLVATHATLGQNWFFNKADTGLDSLPQKSFLQLRYQFGRMADPKTQAINYIQENPFQSIDFRFGIYGYGRKKWHQLHHYPNYGLGVSKVVFQPFGNILGNPWTAYLFYNQPFLKMKKSSLSYDFSFGLAYPWKSYDQVTNPEQLAIGSRATGLLALALQYDFRISDRLDGTLGIGVNHFSNGRIRSPNRGLNLYSMNTSVRYRLGPLKSSQNNTFRESSKVSYSIGPFKPFYEFYFVFSGGAVTTFQDRNDRSLFYKAASASVDIARHYGLMGKYGLGFDWSYDESLKEVYENDYPSGVPPHLLFWPGVHISHEYLIHRWTFVTQAGVNLQQVGDKGTGYGRLALRYDVGKHIFVRAGIRVYRTVVSDFIEWGVGYSGYKMKGAQ